MRLEEFPRAAYPLAWQWLQQFPEHNFDDLGPRTYPAFVAEMDARRARGEQLWIVKDGARYVGMIGLAPISERAAMFHGVCFDKSVHGQGIAARAVAEALAREWQAGREKVSAAYFADNTRVDGLFRKLGAQHEGMLRRQTTRAGSPVDMRLAAFFKEF